jgi:hypothetical protein
MAAGIPEEALQAFRALGTIAEAPAAEPGMLDRLRPFDAVNRQHWDVWFAVVDPMDQTAHATVARGLVIAEEQLHWSGGSVAAAIWVFRSFQRKYPGAADELAEWMLQHSSNPWVPYGTNRGSARSLTELHAHKEQDATRRVIAAEDTRLREDLAQARREAARRLEELRQSESKARSATRNQLLEELAALPLRERLLHLASDQSHPLLYYPADLAAGPLDTLDPAGRWALDQVKAKAALITRGPWRQWLLSAVGPTSPPPTSP